MLKYQGNGAYIPGVPKRDLSDAEVGNLSVEGLGDTVAKIKAALVASGLYKLSPSPRKSKEDEPEQEGGGN